MSSDLCYHCAKSVRPCAQSGELAIERRLRALQRLADLTGFGKILGLHVGEHSTEDVIYQGNGNNNSRFGIAFTLSPDVERNCQFTVKNTRGVTFIFDTSSIFNDLYNR